MALTRGIFIRKDGKNVPSPAGTDPRAARKALAGLVAKGSDGVPRAGVFPQEQTQIVVGSAAGMSYQVRAFEGALAREGSDGVVLYTNDAPVSVSTTPAPATGSRWDLIYVHYPESTSETTSSKPVLGCRQGTPSGTPTKPTSLVPAGAYVLAEALVPAGVSNTLGANIIQAWRYTAARGAPIPVRNQAELSEVQPYTGMRAERLDLGVQCSWDGARWVAAPAAVRFGHMGRTDAFQPLSADQMQTVHMSAAQDLLGGVGFDAARSALTVPVTGRWSISCRFYATGRAGVQAAGQATIGRGSTTLAVEGTYLGFWKADHQDYMSQSAVTQHLVAGDKIFLQMQYGGSTWGTNGYNGSAVEIQYLGPSGSY